MLIPSALCLGCGAYVLRLITIVQGGGDDQKKLILTLTPSANLNTFQKLPSTTNTMGLHHYLERASTGNKSSRWKSVTSKSQSLCLKVTYKI